MMLSAVIFMMRIGGKSKRKTLPDIWYSRQAWSRNPAGWALYRREEISRGVNVVLQTTHNLWCLSSEHSVLPPLCLSISASPVFSLVTNSSPSLIWEVSIATLLPAWFHQLISPQTIWQSEKNKKDFRHRVWLCGGEAWFFCFLGFFPELHFYSWRLIC